MNHRDHKKIERLFLFGEVAKHLSFTKAANELGMSKGHLSAQIKLLEQELATPLLVRSTRHVRLTRAGAEIVQQVTDMRRSLLAVERYARQDQQEPAGTLRITAPKQFAQGLLSDICHQFHQDYPKINVDIDCSYTRYDLTADDFDLAFRATKNPPENLIAKRLFTYDYVCCAAPAYVNSVGKPNVPEQLNRHQCLLALTQDCWTFSGVNYPVQGWLKSNDNALLLEQVLLGRGVALLPRYFVYQHLKNGKLVALFQSYQCLGQAIYLLQPQLIRPPQKVTEFKRYVESFIAQHYAGNH